MQKKINHWGGTGIKVKKARIGNAGFVSPVRESELVVVFRRQSNAARLCGAKDAAEGVAHTVAAVPAFLYRLRHLLVEHIKHVYLQRQTFDLIRTVDHVQVKSLVPGHIAQGAAIDQYVLRGRRAEAVVRSVAVVWRSAVEQIAADATLRPSGCDQSIAAYGPFLRELIETISLDLMLAVVRQQAVGTDRQLRIIPGLGR